MTSLAPGPCEYGKNTFPSKEEVEPPLTVVLKLRRRVVSTGGAVRGSEAVAPSQALAFLPIPFLHPPVSDLPLPVRASKVLKRFAISPSSTTAPFIFFKQESAEANCGGLEIFCSIALAFAISEVSFSQNCSLVDLQIETSVTFDLSTLRCAASIRVSLDREVLCCGNVP
ncbi:hypothetical protein EYF80_037167 [Liparis tanakae]|uniref:Uncharacterized protein n=1 Tax=Liparis tanakae TaxID=230148 RepID=A0A4Z2GGP1_9TELE|nr:hypothetical protein EYF80_037167 [Liparis tanakae]